MGKRQTSEKDPPQWGNGGGAWGGGKSNHDLVEKREEGVSKGYARGKRPRPASFKEAAALLVRERKESHDCRKAGERKL